MLYDEKNTSGVCSRRLIIWWNFQGIQMICAIYIMGIFTHDWVNNWHCRPGISVVLTPKRRDIWKPSELRTSYAIDILRVHQCTLDTNNYCRQYKFFRWFLIYFKRINCGHENQSINDCIFHYFCDWSRRIWSRNIIDFSFSNGKKPAWFQDRSSPSK